MPAYGESILARRPSRRCAARVEGGQVVADAFDYIEYPKILSQPEAEPEKMIQDALEQFLSRNDVKGCKVALAVPGQSGLAKFFKPPPVDAKKIPEIVKYEARQQIPFALEDVIWDFQQMGGGSRGRWLCVGNGSGPVRDETRTGLSGHAAVSMTSASSWTSFSWRR